MQYLQVLRKFKYFCNVAIIPIKRGDYCTRVLGQTLFAGHNSELR